MIILKKIFNFISFISLLFTILGMVIYYILEFISSFDILPMNMVEIGSVFWTIIYICFGITVCSFILLYFIDK